MKNARIYFILVGIMMLWGFNVPLLKIIVGTFTPVTITALRIFTASICVFIILAFLKLLRLPTFRETVLIVCCGLLNVVAHHYFLSVGLSLTSSTNGGLILGLGPILVAVLSIIFLNKRLTFIRLAGFILGLAGVSFTVLAGGGMSAVNAGDISIFFSILTQACSFVIINKFCKTIDPRLLTGYMLLFGSVMLFIISLITEKNGLSSLANGSPRVWTAFFLSAVFATAIGHMTYNFAIARVGAAESAIFMNLNTLFALAGSVLILNETVHASHLIGLVLIISGVILGSGAYEDMRMRLRRKHGYDSVR
ncbi:DMT family transporter [Bacillus sp. FJAT-42376]|uniref:DMT family transporter n=1 Tax=Bacillus sp. FJAT-42376 TaxID=2014076 RepID=UPI000F4E105F|nr:DMT family transporter [Bacillus sp. FJAT-42376]AZB41618.1 DMT family transporter [Bacillus sp. FJAT-42376]